MSPAALVIKVRMISNLLIYEGPRAGGSRMTRVHASPRSWRCQSPRWTNTASKNQMASQRSRVMSTGPAGGEPCLGRAKRSCRAGSQPSPFAWTTTMWRSAAPAVAKTTRLAILPIPGGVFARDSPNVPLTAHASN